MIGELWSLPGLVALLPLLAALFLPFLRHRAAAAWVCIGVATASFALACRLPWEMRDGTLLLVDGVSAHATLLTAFVGMTTAWFSRGYMAVEEASGRLDAPRLAKYHALFMGFLGAMLLALLANNTGLAWVAVETATIAAVLVVELPRTENATEASWKFFLICGVGIALALFGTLLLYLAAVPATPGGGLAAMRWTALAQAAPQAQGPLLTLAFVFLLLGYGTKAALAPLHGWMPDAHAEGPTPVSAVLAGSILNVALIFLLRVRGVMAANAAAMAPGPPLMALGLLSVLLGSFGLWRRRDIKRFFAFSSVEQSGVVAVAFGLGGPAAVFAGLLHMTFHTLAKAAVFHCVGRISQMKGSQSFLGIGGLLGGHRLLALTLAAGMVAVAGLPPFGLFASEFLIVGEVVRRAPLAALPLGLGLVVGGWALAARLLDLCFAPATPDPGPVPGPLALLPAWLHLALVFILGFAMPAVVAAWFSDIAAGVR